MVQKGGTNNMEYNGCKKHKYDKVEIADPRLVDSMNDSIKGIASGKCVAVKKRGCY